jgi:hypothetical protein
MASPAEADVVYDNGPFSGSSGVSFGSSTTADDFVLDDKAVLTSMSFDGFHTVGGSLGPTLQWFIYADAGGSPGATLHSALAENVVVTPMGMSGTWLFFHVEFDFGQPVALDAGTTYWIGLLSPDGPLPQGLAWGSSTELHGNMSHRLLLGQDEWIAVANELNFLLIAQTQIIEVGIKPDSDPNSINPFRRGVIPVAILTTEDFDALTVDADSVRFGPAEAEKRHKQAHVEDVDGDGDLDLLLHFRTQDTGIAPGDTEACLSGQTHDGVPITGCDSVRTVPPN